MHLKPTGRCNLRKTLNVEEGASNMATKYCSLILLCLNVSYNLPTTPTINAANTTAVIQVILKLESTEKPAQESKGACRTAKSLQRQV